jgi:hypothetical protein
MLKSINDGYYTQKELNNSLNYRKDTIGRHKGRTIIDFYADIKLSFIQEEADSKLFVKVCKKNGHIVKFENHGNDDRGEVRLTNGKKRNLPDYKMWIDGKMAYVDLKNFQGYPSRLKLHDIESYIEKDALLLCLTKREFVLYKKEALEQIVEQINENHSRIKEFGNKAGMRVSRKMIEKMEKEKWLMIIKF